MSNQNFPVYRSVLALIVACVAMAAAAPQVLAATFGVNTTDDSSDAGGCTTATVCSLRDAVAAANAAPGSTINVRAGHYTLNTGSTPLGSWRSPPPPRSSASARARRSSTVTGRVACSTLSRPMSRPRRRSRT